MQNHPHHILRIQRYVLILALLAGFVSPAHAAQKPTDIITVQVREDIKVVYDIKVDEREAGVGKALYYLRGLYEAYRKQGISPEQVHLSADFHGMTVTWLFNDEAWQNHTLDPFAVNPNSRIVAELIELGASIEVCNATLKAHGWDTGNLVPGVRVVHDAYTRMIDLQQEGYAYIRF